MENNVEGWLLRAVANHLHDQAFGRLADDPDGNTEEQLKILKGFRPRSHPPAMACAEHIWASCTPEFKAWTEENIVDGRMASLFGSQLVGSVLGEGYGLNDGDFDDVPAPLPADQENRFSDAYSYYWGDDGQIYADALLEDGRQHIACWKPDGFGGLARADG